MIPVLGMSGAQLKILVGLVAVRKSLRGTETEPDKQSHAVEELPRSSHAPPIRVPIQCATGNCPRLRRMTEQRCSRPEGEADHPRKTDAEEKADLPGPARRQTEQPDPRVREGLAAAQES